MALDAEYQTRLEALYAWRSGFMAANTVMSSPTTWIGPDMDLADGVVAAFADALGEIHETAAAAAEWDAAFADMQADLDWLHGVSGVAGWAVAPPDGVPGPIWWLASPSYRRPASVSLCGSNSQPVSSSPSGRSVATSPPSLRRSREPMSHGCHPSRTSPRLGRASSQGCARGIFGPVQ